MPRPRPIRTRRRVLAIAIGAAALASVESACFAPTEVTLTLSTNVACDAVARFGGAQVAVAKRSPELASADTAAVAGRCETDVPGGDSPLGTLVVVPSGDRRARMVVQVTLATAERATPCAPPADIEGCIVARRIVTFRQNRGLSLPIALDRSCIGVPCEEQDETCRRGVCVPATTSCTGDACVLAVDAPEPGGPGGTTPGGGAPGGGAADGGPAGGDDAGPQPFDDGGAVFPSGDAAACPPRPEPCGPCATTCCVLEDADNAVVLCDPDCASLGNPLVCSEDCQCGAGTCIGAGAGCTRAGQNYKGFCNGSTCKPIQ